MAHHKNDLSSINDVEIEPLSDEALEDVAGGEAAGSSNCCSCSNCSTTEPSIEPDRLAE